MFPSAAPAGNKTTNYTNSAAYNWSHWAGENQIPLGVEFSHPIELDTDFTGLDSIGKIKLVLAILSVPEIINPRPSPALHVFFLITAQT